MSWQQSFQSIYAALFFLIIVCDAVFWWFYSWVIALWCPGGWTWVLKASHQHKCCLKNKLDAVVSPLFRIPWVMLSLSWRLKNWNFCLSDFVSTCTARWYSRGFLHADIVAVNIHLGWGPWCGAVPGREITENYHRVPFREGKKATGIKPSFFMLFYPAGLCLPPPQGDITSLVDVRLWHVRLLGWTVDVAEYRRVLAQHVGGRELRLNAVALEFTGRSMVLVGGASSRPASPAAEWKEARRLSSTEATAAACFELRSPVMAACPVQACALHISAVLWTQLHQDT